MWPEMYVNYAVEGATDAAVARRMLQASYLEPGPEFVLGGKGKLDQRIPNYNRAAAFSPWLVLRDFDQEENCPIDLVNRLAPNRNPHFYLRIPVQEVEVWLLADRREFAAYFGVRITDIPKNLETLPDPKRIVVELASRSRRRDVQKGMPPTASSGRRIGPLYVALLTEFARTRWSPMRAAASGAVPSLQRALDRLKDVPK